MLLLLLELVGVGLVAGIAGGMLGIGGGLVMIPALLFLRGDVDGPNAIHLYKLAAIMTSIAIVLPAAIRHAKTGALQVPRSNAMRLPATSAMIVGVILSYFLAGPLTIVLRRTFGVAMIAAVLFQIWQHARRTRHPADAAPRRLAAAASTGCELAARQERKLVVTTAAPAGFLAGFLGIGGGAWAVPIQSMGFHVPLRSAIANSTALIAWIAPWTAVVQGIAVRALPDAPLQTAFLYAGLLIPSALLGGWIGAGLTHRLPLAWVRGAFFALMLLAGIRLCVG